MFGLSIGIWIRPLSLFLTMSIGQFTLHRITAGVTCCWIHAWAVAWAATVDSLTTGVASTTSNERSPAARPVRRMSGNGAVGRRP